MRKVDETIVHRLICHAQFEPGARLHLIYEVMGLNSDSRVAREKVSADKKSIAFSEVLSLPKMQALNEGVQDVLHATAPEHDSTLSSLLAWHAKGRTSLPPSFITINIIIKIRTLPSKFLQILRQQLASFAESQTPFADTLESHRRSQSTA